MGEALEQVNQRVLFLAGYPDDPGVVIWPDNMPRDMLTDLQADQIELASGTVSKETIANENGRDWLLEQERMADEKAAAGNIGSMFIEQFNRGL